MLINAKMGFGLCLWVACEINNHPHHKKKPRRSRGFENLLKRKFQFK